MLGQKNLFTEDCPDSAISICFEGGMNCDIKVVYDEGEEYSKGRVEKGEESIEFRSDALMYAGIFSDKVVYECQVKRLMQRIEKLSLIYYDKSRFVAQQGCNSNLNLLGLNNAARNYEELSDFDIIAEIAEDIQNKNDLADCKLW